MDVRELLQYFQNLELVDRESTVYQNYVAVICYLLLQNTPLETEIEYIKQYSPKEPNTKWKACCVVAMMKEVLASV